MLIKIQTALLVLLTCAATAKSEPSVRLKWKIPVNDTLRYQTVMEDLDSSTFSLYPDGPMWNDTTSAKIFDQLRKINTGFNYVSKLANADQNVVSVTIVAIPKEPGKEETGTGGGLKSMMLSMSRGVVLRGSVFADGGIHSFWINNRQRNLLSVLFELPSAAVKVGDTWSLDLHLVSNDQNFTCDSSYAKHDVKLVNLEIANGDTVAVIRYDIMEYVNGQFGSPFAGQPQPTSMLITHYAEAKFSVVKGRWLAYDGIMQLDATGFMSAHQRTKFSLVKQ